MRRAEISSYKPVTNPANFVEPDFWIKSEKLRYLLDQKPQPRKSRPEQNAESSEF
jgi:hypothetical protein